MAEQEEARLTLDVSRAVADRLGENGLTEDAIKGLSRSLKDVLTGLSAGRDKNQTDFWSLPQDEETITQTWDLAEGIARRFDNLVVLGIGGSSLGPRALISALRNPLYNLLPPEARERRPRVLFCDNVDPESFGAMLDLLPLSRTAFNVISKSGSTAETMAQLQIVRHRLDLLHGEEAREHLVLTTDPAEGPLRAIAESEATPSFAIPAAVGGRYSVLSPVGLFPAAVAGVDIQALCAGAAAMEQRCWARDILANPAALLATMLFLFDREAGRPIDVFMAYSDALARLCSWQCQLWAESLGKRLSAKGEEVFSGPTPVAAVGATDQHSQLQLFLEGPQDKVVVFIGAEQYRRDVEIPEWVGSEEAIFQTLGGKSLGKLLQAEQKATALALARAGRPSITLTLPEINPRHVGELLMLLQCTTAIAGGLYGVNPFDQPGVELGKRYTWGLMGREGFDKDGKEAEGEPEPEPWMLLR